MSSPAFDATGTCSTEVGGAINEGIADSLIRSNTMKKTKKPTIWTSYRSEEVIFGGRSADFGRRRVNRNHREDYSVPRSGNSGGGDGMEAARLFLGFWKKKSNPPTSMIDCRGGPTCLLGLTKQVTSGVSTDRFSFSLCYFFVQKGLTDAHLHLSPRFCLRSQRQEEH